MVLGRLSSEAGLLIYSMVHDIISSISPEKQRVMNREPHGQGALKEGAPDSVMGPRTPTSYPT